MPRPQPLILLPPSEGKSQGGDGPPWRPGTTADPHLDRHRKLLLAQAAAAGAIDRRGPTTRAIERYTGVLYRELAWTTLPRAAQRRGAQQVRIVSGLWGIVAPDDPIPHYKLKMSASLEGFGRLSTWWRPRLVPTLADLAAGATVWDLLPIEHTAAMDWPAIEPARRVTVRFVDDQGRTVSHWNKLLKGALVRWLLREQPPGPEALAGFEHPLGYRLDEPASIFGADVAPVVLRQRS